MTADELTQAIVKAVIPFTKQAAEGAAQAQQQMVQMQQQMAEAMLQSQQQMQQVMAMVAQSNKQIAAAVQALAAPRKRIPIRDQNGRVVEAHDVPMSMQ